jgi:hypothetical protein
MELETEGMTPVSKKRALMQKSKNLPSSKNVTFS